MVAEAAPPEPVVSTVEFVTLIVGGDEYPPPLPLIAILLIDLPQYTVNAAAVAPGSSDNVIEGKELPSYNVPGSVTVIPVIEPPDSVTVAAALTPLNE